MLKTAITRIKWKFLSKFVISLETGNPAYQHSCAYCGLYDRMGVELRKCWWHWCRQVCSTESIYCSNFLSSRAKWFNSRPRPAKISAELLGSLLKSRIHRHLTCLSLGTETVKKNLHAILNDWFVRARSLNSSIYIHDISIISLAGLYRA